MKIQHGQTVIIPASIATCPECGGTLFVTNHETDDDTGRPIAGGLSIDCGSDDDDSEECHRYWQSDWQDVIDKIRRWVNAIL